MKQAQKLTTLLVIITLIFTSCGKDDDAPQNTAPQIANKEFTVAEDTPHLTVFGNIAATDADNDALVYSITTNDNDLFAISETGELSLDTKKELNYGTAQTHSITVAVTDGTNTSEATITITVTQVYVHIPDANFKAELVANTTINTNGNTEIELTEAIAFTGAINVISKDISDLTGIEAFINITGLDCGDNNLSSLDVSKNVALQFLRCLKNNLSNLDVSRNVELILLNCADNNLSSLDVSANTKLGHIQCQVNSLTSLDVSTNTALDFLHCGGNKLSSLDVSVNNILTELYCQQNSLTSLLLANGNNTILSIMTAINNPDLTCIQIDAGFTAPINWQKDATASYNIICN